jgi:hypothetical protein
MTLTLRTLSDRFQSKGQVQMQITGKDEKESFRGNLALS